MAKYTFDPVKHEPASGRRQDYIKPGQYKMKIVKYSDKPSNAGSDMHSFGFQVTSKGEMQGKHIDDWFVMPKKRTDSTFPLQRLNALIVAVVQPKALRKAELDLAKLKGKEVLAEVGDVRQEASKGTDGREFPARTVSRIAEYIDPRTGDDEDEDEDDDAEDEDAEDEEEEEEDEDEAPPPRRARAAAATATKAKPKAAAKAPARRRAAAVVEDDDDEEEDDDDDFPFDDDDDD